MKLSAYVLISRPDIYTESLNSAFISISTLDFHGITHHVELEFFVTIFHTKHLLRVRFHDFCSQFVADLDHCIFFIVNFQIDINITISMM